MFLPPAVTYCSNIFPQGTLKAASVLYCGDTDISLSGLQFGLVGAVFVGLGMGLCQLLDCAWLFEHVL